VVKVWGFTAEIYIFMLLKITVFISGAAVMILELIGARVLAPYLGTSIIVWTSLIGVVMASLSVGYYLGGKAADTKADYKILASIIFMAGVSIGTVAISKSVTLSFLQLQIADMRWASLLGALILFTPANVLLGAVSPYAVKLYFRDPERIGSTVGNLYAISTVGSIFGTYVTGFFLISHFGSTNLLFSLAVFLVFLSLLIYPVKVMTRCFLVLAFSAMPLFNSNLQYLFASAGFLDVDTKYNRVWILDGIDPVSGRPVRTLSTGARYIQSAMFLDGDDLFLEYIKFFNLAGYFNQNIKKALMIGGGAYSYPKDFLSRHKDTEMDVVEIDPGLTDLARKFFGLKGLPRLNVFHQDGRVFLSKTDNKYDAVFIDAFASSVPFHLTTQEFVAMIFNRLNDGGVVAMNIIASIEGDTGRFLRAEYATYKLFSDFVYVFPVQEPKSGNKIQNILLVAVKRDVITSDVPRTSDVVNNEFKKYLDNLWTADIEADMPILTDNFAPVDQYLVKVL
jgi:spermidine synthase